MKKVLIAYIPVLHEGYRKFITTHLDVEALYVFGDALTATFDYLKKDIRALDPKLIVTALQGWNLGFPIEILDDEKVKNLQKEKVTIVMPDEDICHELREMYFKDYEVEFDSVFLRWDKHNSVAEKPVTPDLVISQEKFDKEVMSKALKESEKSSDFWRHIGAALVKNGEIISLVHNTHVPSPHMPYVHSDPRNAFKKGVNIDISTGIHAEARLIAEAAEKGLSLAGASLYVTTFPCPTCAKLIAYSGVTTVYAQGGYAVLDGESILKARNVKIIFVESDSVVKEEEWKGYKK